MYPLANEMIGFEEDWKKAKDDTGNFELAS